LQPQVMTTGKGKGIPERLSRPQGHSAAGRTVDLIEDWRRGSWVIIMSL